MKELIEGYAAQLTEALAIAAQASLKPASQPLHHVVIAGMGGSGIGGNLVQSFANGLATVPIVVSKSYDLPAFVNQHTLFLACSFSGNTEETLDATHKALQAGAHIVAITSGGKLGQLAQQHGFDAIAIPGRSGSPRASIGYSYVQLLQVLHAHGIIDTNFAAQLAASSQLLASHGAEIKEEAARLAAACKGKLVFLYADSKLEAVVLRAQQQIAENSKHIAHANVLPEMNHNELVGWEHPAGIFAHSITLLLRTSHDHARTAIRMDVCSTIFAQHSSLHTLQAKGESLVEQVHYLIHLLDWLSYYLAEENGADPFPVKVIDHLKNELAKHAS